MTTEHRRWMFSLRSLWPIVLIPAFGLLLIAALWAATLLQLSVDRNFVLHRATQDVESVAATFEQDILRVIKGADRWALRVKYEFEATGKADLRAILPDSLLSPDDISRVAVANATGYVIANNRDTKPFSVAERAYFQRHMRRDTARLDISEPVMSRNTHEKMIVASRRLNAADGSFAGVVAMSLRPDTFASFYQESQLGKNGMAGVLGSDGAFRAWRVGQQPVTTPAGHDTRLLTASATTPVGSYQGTSAIDGVERLMAYRTLENYPLVVAVGRATDEVLADFDHQRAIYIAISSAASAVIVGFFTTLTLLAVRLKRRGSDIRAQQSFLLTLVDNIPIGVAVRDARAANFGKVVLWNNTAEHILGISRDKAVGSTARDVFPLAVAARVEERDRELLTSPMVQEFTERSDEFPGHEQRCLHVIRAPIFDADDQVEYIVSITSDVTQEQERADSARLASKVFETTADAIILSDAQDRVIMVNAAFSRLMMIKSVDILGRFMRESPFGALDIREYENQMQRLTTDGHFSGETVAARSHGGPLPCWLSASCVRDPDGQIVNYIRVFTDISLLKSSQHDLHALAESLRQTNAMLTDEIAERTRAASALHRSNTELQRINVKLQEAQGQVLQSEKLASIGQLAAGVAHEINNPIGYVLSNLGTLEGYVQNLFEMLSAYEAAEGTLPSETTVAELAAIRARIELAYLKQDIPNLMKESREGISRVRKIVEALRDFSRTDRNQEWVWANLHSGINSTLNIVSNEIKYKAEVVKEYGDLPDIECLPTQLNQVFMNLLVNAAHAVNTPRGRIVIRSGTEGDHAWVEVADNGSGMPPEIKARIFDPFFTTKPVGKGTGLGLSLTYGIVKKHNGWIDLESEVGKGTTFRVWLPIRRKIDGDAAQTQSASADAGTAAAEV